MDDRTLVAAMVSKDHRGLEGVYGRYADRIYTYCRALLRDPDAAADAVHDTFVAAQQHAARLRHPDRSRPWLFAIARNECLRRRARHVALGRTGDVTTPQTGQAAGPTPEELRVLVWAAADGVDPGHREIFELMVGHDLPARDVGAVLGISADHTRARLSRAREQIERSLAALLVARAGGEHCPDLARMLRGWGSRLAVLLRWRVTRHIDSCVTCAERRARLRPAAMLDGYAALPLLAAPDTLWDRVWLTSGHPGAAGARRRIRDRTARFDPTTGFPRPLPTRGRRHTYGIAVLLVVTLMLGTFLCASGGEQRADLRTSPSQADPSHTPTSGAAPTTAATGTPSTSAPPPSSRPPATLSPTVAPPPTTAFQARAAARAVCTGGDLQERKFALSVIMISDGTKLDTATLRWSPPRGASKPMEVTGTSASAVAEGLTGSQVTWTVKAISTRGNIAVTQPVSTPNPCP